MVDKKVFDEFIDMLEYVATNISGLTRPNSDKTYEKMCDLENIVYNTDNIVMVDNSCNNYSTKDWKHIIQENKDDLNFLIGLIHKSELLPDWVVLDIIKETMSGLNPQYSLDSGTCEFIRTIFSKKFNQSFFDAIVDNIPIKFLGNVIALISRDEHCNAYPFKINQEYIDKSGELIFNRLKSGNYSGSETVNNVSQQHEALCIISKEKFYEFANIVLEENNVDSRIVSALLMNKNLDPNDSKDLGMVNSLLDYCDPLYFQEIPLIAADGLSKILYEYYLLNHIDEEKNKFIDTAQFNRARNLIRNALEDKYLPKGVEYDLANILLSMKIKGENELVYTLFSNTDNPDIASQIDKLFGINKMNSLISNPNAPKDLIDKKIKEYIKKIKKQFGENEKSFIASLNSGHLPVPSDWINYLNYLIPKTTLSDEDNRFIISLDKINLLSTIAMSSGTPVHILDEIIDKYGEINSRLTFIATFNKFCIQNNVPAEIADKIKNNAYDLSDSFYHRISYPNKKNADKFNAYFTKSGLSSGQILFASRLAIEEIVNADIEIAKKLSSYLKTLLSDNNFKIKKETLKEITVYFDGFIDFKEKMKNDKFENIASVSEPYVDFIKRLHRINNRPYLYLNLYEILKDYEEYSITIDKLVESLEKNKTETKITEPVKNETMEYEQLEIW